MQYEIDPLRLEELLEGIETRFPLLPLSDVSDVGLPPFGFAPDDQG